MERSLSFAPCNDIVTSIGWYSVMHLVYCLVYWYVIECLLIVVLGLYSIRMSSIESSTVIISRSSLPILSVRALVLVTFTSRGMSGMVLVSLVLLLVCIVLTTSMTCT